MRAGTLEKICICQIKIITRTLIAIPEKVGQIIKFGPMEAIGIPIVSMTPSKKYKEKVDFKIN